MAETARRLAGGSSADVARRLIARPIRLQSARPFAAAPLDVPDQHDDAPEAPAAQDATRRLQAELLVMKAVLKAERQENEALRALVGSEDEDLGEEARAVRDRWASAVDRLLRTAR